MASKRRDDNTMDYRQSPLSGNNASKSGSNNNNHTHSSNENSINSNNNDNPESLWTRIQTSATTLMQDAVTRPSGAALGADLAQALNDSNGKTSSSSSSSFSSGSSSWEQSHSTHSGGTRSSSSTSSSSFRSNPPVQEGSRFGFDQDSPHYYEDYPAIYELQEKGNDKNKGKAKSFAANEFNDITSATNMNMTMINTHNFSEYEIAWINATQSDADPDAVSDLLTSTSIQSTRQLQQQQQQNLYQDEAERHDGAEVVALLSNPFFQPGYTSIHNNDNNNNKSNNNDNEYDHYDEDMTEGDTYLTPTEIQMLDSFRRQQSHSHSHPHSSTNSNKTITSKSLIPDIDTFLAENDHTPSTTSTAATASSAAAAAAAAALRTNVLSHLPGAQDWMHVDERYHDEVWGYLRPALEAAATELEEKKKQKNASQESSGGSEEGDGPAVRRLKMILRHMRE